MTRQPDLHLGHPGAAVGVDQEHHLEQTGVAELARDAASALEQGHAKRLAVRAERKLGGGRLLDDGVPVHL